MFARVEFSLGAGTISGLAIARILRHRPNSARIKDGTTLRQHGRYLSYGYAIGYVKNDEINSQ